MLGYMTQAENPWDVLASHFAPEEPDNIEWDAVDNVLLAQPVILDYLAHHLPDPAHKRLLDFGCGGGQFASRLQGLGYEVAGMDSARAMINVAQNQYGMNVPFTVGSEHDLPSEPSYDVITSVMTLQFIPNAHEAIGRLAAALNPNGLLVFAVHNHEFVSDWIKARQRFIDFDSVDQPTKATLTFGHGVAIPIYLRTSEAYNDIAKDHDLEPQLEKYPPFTADFLSKYPVDGPTQHSEFMILGYQKTM